MANEDAIRILEQVVARQDPRRWRHGTWLGRETLAEEQAVLDGLDPWLGYPHGGRAAFDLPGWDECSIWGFDPTSDCYFAQLWRNRGDDDAPDDPDIWINGWDTIDGRQYLVTTTHMLAREIEAATGCDLAAACSALSVSPPR